MDKRSRIQMTDDETQAFLRGRRKLQLATINADGTPHLVTMYYTLVGDALAFWTYRASQKARNLDRDPRLSCLVEAGDGYFDLRGVQITGTAQRVDELSGVADIGQRIARHLSDSDGGASATDSDAADEYALRAARKRVAYIVEARRVVSWDHRKLAAAPATGAKP